MKRVVFRKDLMKKAEYSKKFGINRPSLDRMIDEGKLVVERISNTDYIRVETA